MTNGDTLPEHTGEYKLITAGRLIDGKGGRPTAQGAVLVKGSKIVVAGPRADVAVPEGATVETYDYPDMSIMPGMVDCHTHLNGFGDGRSAEELVLVPEEVLTLQAARNARASFFSGVTTVRENGPISDTTFRLRDAINQGIAVGPRMLLCGRPVAIIGGHMGIFGTEVTGPVEAAAMTRQLVKEGADYIKITATGGSTLTSFPFLPSFDVDELRGITEAAHGLGKLTGAHTTSTQGIINCLDAGVDMLIHCIFNDPDGTHVFRPDVAERIAEQGAFVNPTIHVIRARVWEKQDRLRRQGLTPHEQATLDTERRELDQRFELCSRMIEMGLKVVTGSDSSWGSYQLGNTPYEAECLVMAGYSPMQGVLSVTSEAAKALDIDDVVGTLERGKEADVIVIDGDPTQDIADLWKVTEVFKAGQRIDRGSAESRAATRQLPPSR